VPASPRRQILLTSVATLQSAGQISCGRNSVTLTDINSVIATVAAVGSFAYGALYYHRPRTSGATASPQAAPTASSTRRIWIPLILTIVAWAAVAVNWYILRGNQTEIKLPVSSDNARIDIVIYQPILDDATKNFFVDFYITNHGKISAIAPLHQGITLGSNNKIPSLADYDAVFTFLKAQIAINKEVRTSEIQPGQTNI
jgi:hypothetical protein